MDDDKVHLTKEEARAGATPHVTRYILSVSLLLIVILFAGLLLIWQ